MYPEQMFPVYMHSPDGRIYVQQVYAGYGMFGGKDLYVLVAELNHRAVSFADYDREVGYELTGGIDRSAPDADAAAADLLFPVLSTSAEQPAAHYFRVPPTRDLLAGHALVEKPATEDLTYGMIDVPMSSATDAKNGVYAVPENMHEWLAAHAEHGACLYYMNLDFAAHIAWLSASDIYAHEAEGVAVLYREIRDELTDDAFETRRREFLALRSRIRHVHRDMEAMRESVRRRLKIEYDDIGELEQEGRLRSANQKRTDARELRRRTNVTLGAKRREIQRLKRELHAMGHTLGMHDEHVDF